MISVKFIYFELLLLLVFYIVFVCALPSKCACANGKCVKTNAFCNGTKECLDELTCVSSCTLPKYHNHGKWKSLNQSVKWKPGGLVTNGTILQNKCNEGYESISEDIYGTCIDGEWSQSFACSKQCPLFNLTNIGQVECIYNDKPRKCSQAIHGTVLKFWCDLFYEKLGSSDVRLCKNGAWDNPTIICTPTCGGMIGSGSFSVGSRIASGNYPWQVALFKNQKPQCGGSILTTNIVLTAAHCVVTDNVDGTVSMDPNLYEVAVGKYYRLYKDPRDSAMVQYTKVSKIIPAQQYRGRFDNYIGDIALLITQEHFKIIVPVQPICWDRSSMYHLRSGQLGVVTGWGLLQENSDPPDELRELEVPYTNDDECRKKLPFEFAQRYYTYDKLCAGFFNKSKAVCKGDSGNPLAFLHRDNYYVHGVVSVSPQHFGGCDSNQFTFFTNIEKYVDFIEKTIIKYST